MVRDFRGCELLCPSPSNPLRSARFTSFTTEQGLASNFVRSITVDKAGNLWFCTDGGGVSRYDGKAFTSFSTAHGLPDNFIYSIAEDKSGKLWFGTLNGGVCSYDGKGFNPITTD